MASVNKVFLDPDLLRRLYVDEKKSLKQVSAEIGASLSSTRAELDKESITC